MLAATAVASPPLASMACTTSSQAGSLRLDTTTLAPCAASCSQIDRPMPRLPPVTTATLPLRSNIDMRLSPVPGRSSCPEQYERRQRRSIADDMWLCDTRAERTLTTARAAQRLAAANQEET